MFARQCAAHLSLSHAKQPLTWVSLILTGPCLNLRYTVRLWQALLSPSLESLWSCLERDWSMFQPDNTVRPGPKFLSAQALEETWPGHTWVILPLVRPWLSLKEPHNDRGWPCLDLRESQMTVAEAWLHLAGTVSPPCRDCSDWKIAQSFLCILTPQKVSVVLITGNWPDMTKWT